MIDCPYCLKALTGISGTFNYDCYGCRGRALLGEPCKVLRKHMALNMWRYGKVPEWKITPHCGCIDGCIRAQRSK
jgi:hypothetical protein